MRPPDRPAARPPGRPIRYIAGPLSSPDASPFGRPGICPIAGPTAHPSGQTFAHPLGRPVGGPSADSRKRCLARPFGGPREGGAFRHSGGRSRTCSSSCPYAHCPKRPRARPDYFGSTRAHSTPFIVEWPGAGERAWPLRHFCGCRTRAFW